MVSVVIVRIGVDATIGSDTDTSGDKSTVSCSSSSSESLSVSPKSLLKDFPTLSGVFGKLESVVGFLGGVSLLGRSSSGTFSGREGDSVVFSDRGFVDSG